MKKTRFTEGQMVKILRETDKTPVTEVTKKHGISVISEKAGDSRTYRIAK